MITQIHRKIAMQNSKPRCVDILSLHH